ncbi:MAG: HigA family addiction module antitoxin, partial [Candidatus Sericytochromatia bacterium]|nr:HigA family addiction module antitoxin [Candidatus Sericytochromatia bacterium]
IHAIVRERRGITADTALRLARYFGLSEGYWLNVQARYDLLVAREALAAELSRIRPRETA